jgi:hypothetical protein
MTDNGSPYVSTAHAVACRELRLRHLRTRPYRPRTNGKAERFIQTLQNEWAYGRLYASSAERAAALPTFLTHYNYRRRHGSLGHQPPATRLTNLLRNYSLGRTSADRCKRARTPRDRESPPLNRPSEIAIEQVHVRREREGRRVMPEPVLDLDGVAPGREHARGDRVAERVEARPGYARLLAGRREYPRMDVVRVIRPPQASERELVRLPARGAPPSAHRPGLAGIGMSRRACGDLSGPRTCLLPLLPARPLAHLYVRLIAV